MTDIAPPKALQPVHPYCPTCGSTDIVADAWAGWNADGQAWEVQAVFDHSDCRTCGKIGTPEWRPMDRCTDVKEMSQ